MEIYIQGTRLMALRAKLAGREGLAGYEKNCEMIRQEIARIEISTLKPIADSDGNDGA